METILGHIRLGKAKGYSGTSCLTWWRASHYVFDPYDTFFEFRVDSTIHKGQVMITRNKPKNLFNVTFSTTETAKAHKMEVSDARVIGRVLDVKDKQLTKVLDSFIASDRLYNEQIQKQYQQRR